MPGFFRFFRRPKTYVKNTNNQKACNDVPCGTLGVGASRAPFPAMRLSSMSRPPVRDGSLFSVISIVIPAPRDSI